MKLYTLSSEDMATLFGDIENPTGVSDVYIIGQNKDASSYVVFSKTEYPELVLLDIENIPYVYNVAYPCDTGQKLTKELVNDVWNKMRKDNYPSADLYLDGVVKGDNDQVQEYIDACLAVKEKFPKLIV